MDKPGTSVSVQACTRAWRASPFLRRAATLAGGTGVPQAPDARALEWLLPLAQHAWDAPLLAARYASLRASCVAGDAVTDAAAVGLSLRLLRRELLCGLLLRDTAGLADLDEVTGAMTAFAQLAVREALQVLAPELVARYGVPQDEQGHAQDLLVLAMGKGGTGELNVSSDLDLIFVYGDTGSCAPAPGQTDSGRAHTDNQEFFDRLGRRLISLLGDIDAQGFVFRIDMRLRPHGDAGPLVASLGMLEEYFVREGREWERFAWAKARVLSTPVLASAADHALQCRALQDLVQPFVYRRYFDFGAIGAIRELHHKIRAESSRRALGRSGQGADIKLGRGGIREIEFLVQSFCIMRGGREHRLRGVGTVAGLQVLEALGLLPAAEAQRLAADYRFLRRLEHALQYRDDAQTHVIPAGAAERADVAQLLDTDPAQLDAQYAQVSDAVARSFDRLFPAEAGRGAEGVAGSELDASALAQAGFADPAVAAQRLAQLLSGPRLAGLLAPARATLEQLAVQCVRLIAARRAPDGTPATEAEAGPDEILLRWIRLVEVIGRRSTYFSLLLEYPQAHQRVLRLLAAGGWGAEYLLRHPILLDELIDLRNQDFSDAALGPAQDTVPGAAEPYWEAWISEVEAQLLAVPGDVERQMNLLRDAHHAQIFRLLLADLAGTLGLEHLADHLSALADAVLRLCLRAAWRGMPAVQEDPSLPLPEMAIVAYGKLGGRELGYASDLDLAFIYAESADPALAENQARACTALVRRLMSWLTSPTASGVLFEIDLRLRPNGNAGLLVTPIDAFERYQCNADGHGAWVWEHQALTRARVCAGAPALAARFDEIRARVLQQPREVAQLVTAVVDMRRRMLEGHANRSARFDLKHDRGGMVDIEFIVQFLILAHARTHPALLANRGNIGLLAIAAEQGLLPAPAAVACAAAYRQFRQLQHALRLNGHAQARVDPARVGEDTQAVLAVWEAVFGTPEPLPAPAQARLGAR